MKPMVDMEMDDEMAGEMPMPIAAPRQTYPYGLRICLTNSEIQKLGLDPQEACVDGILHLHALARITSVSSNDGPEGKQHRVELQIESMATLESEDSENAAAEKTMKKAAPLYDRS